MYLLEEICDDHVHHPDDAATADALQYSSCQQCSDVLRRTAYYGADQEEKERCQTDATSTEDIRCGWEER